jgi:hypothetical protein
MKIDGNNFTRDDIDHIVRSILLNEYDNGNLVDWPTNRQVVNMIDAVIADHESDEELIKAFQDEM